MTGPALLALLAAFGYGLGDFIAGMLSRRVHYAVVAVLAGIAALGTTVVAVALLTPVQPTQPALLWGAASGIGTAFGTLALFRGLGRGRMGVVAPVSGVTAAAIPVMIGVLLGDRPSLIAWLGVALAVPAIWLVSSGEHGGDGSARSAAGAPRLATSVSDGMLAGIGFAGLFIGLNFAGDDSGLWPVLANELAGLVVFAVALVVTMPRIERRRPAAGALGFGALIGVIGAGSSAAYFLATTAGLLSTVTVLASLYPAVTVILAILVAHEAVVRRQALGLGLVFFAIALIVLG